MDLLCVFSTFGTRLRFPLLVSGPTNCLTVVLRVSFLRHAATETFFSSSFTNRIDARYLSVCSRLLCSYNCFSFDTFSNTRATKPLSNTLTLKMSTTTFSETTENLQHSMRLSPANRRHTLCSSTENPMNRKELHLWTYYDNFINK